MVLQRWAPHRLSVPRHHNRSSRRRETSFLPPRPGVVSHSNGETLYGGRPRVKLVAEKEQAEVGGASRSERK